MDRQLGLRTSVVIGMLCAGTMGYADCTLIDRLDRSVTIQSRLARDPATALFTSDIRQIRMMHDGISDSAALRAVDGNRFAGHGTVVVRFLANSQQLLQRASMDDPQSVRPHFDQRTRENLISMRAMLPQWRCTSEQIAVDAQFEGRRGTGRDSDAEDIAEVKETISALADEVIRPRSLVIVLLVALMFSIVSPVLQRYMLLRRRRAKRHNCAYATQYTCDKTTVDGMLVDINCHGTKFRHEAEPLTQGTQVEIAICDEWITGTVKWSNTHYSGVQFHKLIPLAFIEPVCAAKTAAQTQNGAQTDAALQNIS